MNLRRALNNAVQTHMGMLANGTHPMMQAAPQKRTNEVILVRHARTDFVDQNKIHGMIDVPLNEAGKQEARDLAASVAKENPGVVITSSLKRGTQTAQDIANKAKVPMVESSALLPWNVGDLAGTDRDKAMEKIMDKSKNAPDEKMPNGESFNEYKNRLLGGTRDIIQQYQKPVLVTHSISENLINAWIKKGMPKDLSYDVGTWEKPTLDTAEYEKKKV